MFNMNSEELSAAFSNAINEIASQNASDAFTTNNKNTFDDRYAQNVFTYHNGYSVGGFGRPSGTEGGPAF